MNKRPMDFYSDFNIFLSVVTSQMLEQKSLTVNWLNGVHRIMGTFMASLLLGVVAKISGEFIGEVPLPSDKSLTTGIASRNQVTSLIQKLKNAEPKLTSKEEDERIEKARLIYKGYITFLDGAQRNQGIDELFDDLVNGDEILY
jgi:hypothetical protein